MILSYIVKLFCLSFSAFFLVHAAASLALVMLSPSALRVAGRMRARAASRFLFIIRLLPFGLSLLVVLGMCVPSYLWFEPGDVAETVGLPCIATAVLGAAILAIALVRGALALTGSRRYIRQFQASAKESRLPDTAASFLMIEEDSPLVMLAGLWHPRVIVSRGVVDTLPAEQLDMALQHERAHGLAYDNCKRFLVLLAPDVLPGWHLFSRLERTRAQFAEWAADDQATAGDPYRSLSLASALVRLARLGAGIPLPSLIASLVPGSTDSAAHDLALRVERLLLPTVTQEAPPLRLRAFLGSGTLAFASLMAIWAAGGVGSHASLHALLEGLIR